MLAHTRLTDEMKARIIEGRNVDEPGYVLINDKRLDGYILTNSSGLVFRMDVVEPFTAYPRSTVKMYLADDTLLYTGPLADTVVVQAGQEFKLTAGIRVV